MSSIIEGYYYDIFISYRQKDNKGDRWVSEFVEALKTELEPTFKEEISVYFDINPHDGLLETHDVDASLKEKLKCLVFIPIISQTYCDSKCFAWQNEFCAFNKFAMEDQFGRDIKLSSGNVASRILPIKIHDLDPEDKSLLEDELGGVLRSIEFIYKSAGVNRPLRVNEDHPQDNLNKTYYRDQINKVANAVKEIITALKKPDQHPEEVTKQAYEVKPAHKKNLRAKIIAGSLIILALAVFGYLFIPKLFKSSEQLEKSIAVLPFKLLSDEPDKQYLADGMMDAILLHLSKIEDLRVMSRTSVEQYRGTTKTTRTIGKELNVDYILEGSFQKYGDNVKLIVQLINASEESHKWANEYNRKWEDIFSVQSEVAQTIANELNAVITPGERQKIEKAPTADLKAYDAFLKGQFFYENSTMESTLKAFYWFKEAIRLDSSYALPWTYLSICYWRNSVSAKTPEFKKAKQLTLKSLELNPSSGIALVNIAEMLDNEYNFNSAKEKIDEALKIEPNNPYVLRNAGRFYTLLGKKKESISFCLKALESDNNNSTALGYLLSAYYYAGRYSKALEIIEKRKELGYGDDRIVRYIICLLENNFDKIFNEQDSIKNIDNKDFVLAAANLKLGKRTIAEKIMSGFFNKYKDKIPCTFYTLAKVYGLGNEQKKAFYWLEKSYNAKEREFTYMGVDPAFKEFRNDARMKELMQRFTTPSKEFRNNFYPDTLVIPDIPRNRLDGVYDVTGTFCDYIQTQWVGEYPRTVHLISTGPYSVSIYNPDYEDFKYWFDKQDGDISFYANWIPYFVFDADDNITNVANSVSDSAGSSRTAVLYKGSEVVNKFNESEHSIDVAYQMKQMNVTPNPRNLIIEHYKYIGSRPSK